MKCKNTYIRFSKLVLAAMTAAWFLGVIFGIAVVAWQCIKSPESAALDSLLVYIGAPMTGGIVSYMIKSAIEDNCAHLRKAEASPATDVQEDVHAPDEEEYQ